MYSQNVKNGLIINWCLLNFKRWNAIVDFPERLTYDLNRYANQISEWGTPSTRQTRYLVCFWLSPKWKKAKKKWIRSTIYRNLMFIFVLTVGMNQFTNCLEKSQSVWATYQCRHSSENVRNAMSTLQHQEGVRRGNLSLLNKDNRQGSRTDSRSSQCLSFRWKVERWQDRANAWLYEKGGRGSFWNHIESWCTDRP